MIAQYNLETLCAGVHGLSMPSKVWWWDDDGVGAEYYPTSFRIKRRADGSWYATAEFPSVDWLRELEPAEVVSDCATLTEATERVYWYCREGLKVL